MAQGQVAQSQPFEKGPYLSAAFLCEKVLTEQDGVKSAIRIIDRVTHTVGSPSPPEQMEPFDYELAMLIRFKSGWARGPHSLQVNLIKPSGESPPPVERELNFEGEEDRGVDLVANLVMRFEVPGIYWFEVYLNNVRLTRIPLRIIYLRQVTRKPPGPSPSS